MATTPLCPDTASLVTQLTVQHFPRASELLLLNADVDETFLLDHIRCQLSTLRGIGAEVTLEIQSDEGEEFKAYKRELEILGYTVRMRDREYAEDIQPMTRAYVSINQDAL